MTYDWDGKRHWLLRAVRITTGVGLTVAILSLPMLMFI